MGLDKFRFFKKNLGRSVFEENKIILKGQNVFKMFFTLRI
jgi:hypothetical protein